MQLRNIYFTLLNKKKQKELQQYQKGPATLCFCLGSRNKIYVSIMPTFHSSPELCAMASVAPTIPDVIFLVQTQIGDFFKRRSSYIYCYLLDDTDTLLLNSFIRALDEGELNIYLDYVYEEGLKVIPDVLPVEEDFPYTMMIDKKQPMIEKLLMTMTIVGKCNECPILMYKGSVDGFIRRMESE